MVTKEQRVREDFFSFVNGSDLKVLQTEGKEQPRVYTDWREVLRRYKFSGICIKEEK